MRAVLGIDAAWTANEPSGLAVIVNDGSGWSLRATASSYIDFVQPPDPDLGLKRPRGSIADPVALLDFSHRLLGHPVDIVAVDMPLALEPITARRVSDNKVSSAYGARQCGTHTPSAFRPGPISDNLRRDFEGLGYHLATIEVKTPALLEVYSTDRGSDARHRESTTERSLIIGPIIPLAGSEKRILCPAILRSTN